LPKFLTSGALNLIRNSVLKKANFDIKEINPINAVQNIFISGMFICAEGDTFIDPKHSHKLFENYAGLKEIFKV
jgi:hypothetical protein